MSPMTKEEQALNELLVTLNLLRDLKPNDRSPADRSWAVTITEMEKVAAYFRVYVVDVLKVDVADMGGDR